MVSGIDLSQSLLQDNIQVILSNMDTYAVPIYPDQTPTNDQHLAFTQSLGPIERAEGRGSQAAGRSPPADKCPSPLKRSQELIDFWH